MESSLKYWVDLYQKNKHEAICLDIESTKWNGPISVVGLYQPKEGLVQCQSFIKGQNLTKENLEEVFKNVKMLITFNGLKFDVPKIKSEFPNIIPKNIPVFDLYLFAKKLNMSTSLRVLENTFGIQRLKSYSERKRIAVKLWKKYKTGDADALAKLIEYNKEDTINLYPLAERLVKIASQ